MRVHLGQEERGMDTLDQEVGMEFQGERARL